MMACDYVLVTQLGSPQRAQPPLYPLGLLGEHATVVLASEGERHGHGVLFAALVRIERGQTSDRPMQPATAAPGSAQQWRLPETRVWPRQRESVWPPAQTDASAIAWRPFASISQGGADDAPGSSPAGIPDSAPAARKPGA
jgi:hypothetical protein